MLLFMFSVTLFFQSDYGKNKIISFTNKFSPVRLEFSDFSLNIFKGEVEIDDLVIYDDSNVTIGKIKKTILAIQYKPLFSGKYIADYLIIIEPSIDISSSQINKIKQKIPKKETVPDENIDKEPLDLVVNKLEILNTDLLYKDIERSSEYGFITKKISATVDIKGSDYSLNTVNSKILFNSENINKTIINDSLNISLKDSELEIERARFRTDGLDLSLKGIITELFTLPVLDVNLVAKVDNSKFFDRSEMFKNDSGKFSITSSITGEANYPELEISLKHPEGIIYGQQVNSLDLNAHYIDKILTIKTELLKGKNEKFNISGILDLTSVFEKGLVSSKPELENIVYDLSVIAERFSLNNIPDMPDIKLDFNLELQGKGIKTDDIKANVALNTSLSPFKFKEFRLKKKATIKANINWDKGTFV
ncbi:MAG: hypothetical protein PF574_03275, partial [Candidatus Delongbacteria bacterium]|nr:hypothetical protein [Candidatus Delongbacteria bacterium]